MRNVKKQFVILSLMLSAELYAISGCVGRQAQHESPEQAVEASPSPAPPPQPPAYTRLPHPLGYGLGDLKTLFYSASAPPLGSLKSCQDDWLKLKADTPSEEERRLGLVESVKRDPIRYHWCFYGSILNLEEQLKSSDYIDDKQKQVLSAYSFLAPVARAFESEFSDSRYWRWAVQHYRKLSDYVFYRSLELTPESTSRLVDIGGALGDPSPAVNRDPASH